jgi:hypothetical protein
MSEALQDFIARRLSEIDEACAALDDERSRLLKAASAAGISLQTTQPLARDRRRNQKAASGTIKKAVLDVLLRAGRPMQTQEILKEINALLATDYPRSSLSPQLSRLKADGKINHNGEAWEIDLLS